MLTHRIVWVVTGVAWASRSLMEIGHPDYWDPVTGLDWASIWTYSVALLLLAPAVLLMARLAPRREVTRTARAVAAGAVVAATANGLEDGLGVAWLGPAYVVGVLVAGLGLLALAVVIGRSGWTRLGWLASAVFLGVVTFPVGGGVLVLAAFAWLAIAPAWFAMPSGVALPVLGVSGPLADAGFDHTLGKR